MEHQTLYYVIAILILSFIFAFLFLRSYKSPRVQDEKELKEIVSAQNHIQQNLESIPIELKPIIRQETLKTLAKLFGISDVSLTKYELSIAIQHELSIMQRSDLIKAALKSQKAANALRDKGQANISLSWIIASFTIAAELIQRNGQPHLVMLAGIQCIKGSEILASLGGNKE